MTTNGFGATSLTVLEQLGGPAECRRTGTAATWTLPGADPLNVVALECRADPTTPWLTRLPGLPDAAYGGDGQLTKQEIRALSLAALAPGAGAAAVGRRRRLGQYRDRMVAHPRGLPCDHLRA